MKSVAVAVACGLALAGLPFLQSGLGDRGHGAAFHMDHSPHHGGKLLMLGNHHLEIVERADALELYVSDFERRPLRPEAATIAFDAEQPRSFVWSGYRMTTDRPSVYDWADYRIVLAEGPPLTIRLPAGGASMER
jgi:hypothetical protein